jgi:8-oxo-dGTP pyrophosphatase MutT (NUDIX family)
MSYYINSNGREVSCGVIVTDKKRLVAIKPYGKHNALDLPKGHREDGESAITAAIRELQEETGLEVDRKRLFSLGVFNYTSYKDLELFLLLMNPLPLPASLKCTSYFTDDHGRKVPEATGFELVAFNDVRFYTPLRKILVPFGKKIAIY